jgi:hypothetical protein
VIKDYSIPLFLVVMVLVLCAPLVSLVMNPLVAYIGMWFAALCLLFAIIRLLRRTPWLRMVGVGMRRTHC